MNALKYGVALVLLAVSATACGSTSDTPDAVPSSESPATFETPEDLADALEAGGLECTGLRHTPGAEDPDMTATCNNGAVTIRIIDSTIELSREKTAMAQAVFLKGQTMLAGENWTIVAEDAYTEDAAEFLDGDLIASPS